MYKDRASLRILAACEKTRPAWLNTGTREFVELWLTYEDGSAEPRGLLLKRGLLIEHPHFA